MPFALFLSWSLDRLSGGQPKTMLVWSMETKENVWPRALGVCNKLAAEIWPPVKRNHIFKREMDGHLVKTQLLLSKGSGVVHGEREEVKNIFLEVSHRNDFICWVSSISLNHITPVCMRVSMLLQSPVRNCLVVGRFISAHRYLSFWLSVTSISLGLR